MKSFVLQVLIYILPLWIWAHDASVTGRVIGAYNKKPINHVAVLLKGTAYTCVTDSTGNYRLLNIPPGRYKLIFEAADYFKTERDINLAENEAHE